MPTAPKTDVFFPFAAKAPVFSQDRGLCLCGSSVSAAERAENASMKTDSADLRKSVG